MEATTTAPRTGTRTRKRAALMALVLAGVPLQGCQGGGQIMQVVGQLLPMVLQLVGSMSQGQRQGLAGGATGLQTAATPGAVGATGAGATGAGATGGTPAGTTGGSTMAGYTPSPSQPADGAPTSDVLGQG